MNPPLLAARRPRIRPDPDPDPDDAQEKVETMPAAEASDPMLGVEPPGEMTADAPATEVEMGAAEIAEDSSPREDGGKGLMGGGEEEA